MVSWWCLLIFSDATIFHGEEAVLAAGFLLGSWPPLPVTTDGQQRSSWSSLQ
jgi:hypothetical protein